MLSDLESRLDDSDASITLDFEGVKHVSYSFADEFIGKLVQRAHDGDVAPPTLVNVGPSVYDVIELNLRSRGLGLGAGVLPSHA